MTCGLCGEHLAWDDVQDCAEVGEQHHVECIAICPRCQAAFADEWAAMVADDVRETR